MNTQTEKSFTSVESTKTTFVEPSNTDINTPENTPQVLNSFAAVKFLEDRVAALEGGIGALAGKSLASLQSLLLEKLVSTHDNVVTFNSSQFYQKFFRKYKKKGIEIRYSSDHSLNTFENLLNKNTGFIYLETISSNNYHVPDFQKIKTIAQKFNIPIVVDNSAGAPAFIVKPILHGAHIVIEETKNFLESKESYDVGALLIDGGNFNWTKNKVVRQLHSKYYDFELEKFSQEKGSNIQFSLINFLRKDYQIHFKNSNIKQSFNFIFQLDAAATSLQQKSFNAHELAIWLQGQDSVAQVEYLGLPKHNSYFKALTYLRKGFGNKLTFKVKGSLKEFEIFTSRLTFYNYPKKVKVNFFPEDVSIQLVVGDINASEVKEIISSALKYLTFADKAPKVQDIDFINMRKFAESI